MRTSVFALCNKTEITSMSIKMDNGGLRSCHFENTLPLQFQPSCWIAGNESTLHMAIYVVSLFFFFLHSIYCGLENHRKSCFPHQQPEEGQSQTVSGITKLQKQRCEDWPLLLHLSLLALPTSTSNTSTFLCQWDVASQSLPLIHFYPWCCYFPLLDPILALSL